VGVEASAFWDLPVAVTLAAPHGDQALAGADSDVTELPYFEPAVGIDPIEEVGPAGFEPTTAAV